MISNLPDFEIICDEILEQGGAIGRRCSNCDSELIFYEGSLESWYERVKDPCVKCQCEEYVLFAAIGEEYEI